MHEWCDTEWYDMMNEQCDNNRWCDMMHEQCDIEWCVMMHEQCDDNRWCDMMNECVSVALHQNCHDPFVSQPSSSSQFSLLISRSHVTQFAHEPGRLRCLI